MNFLTTSIVTLCVVWFDLNKVKCGNNDAKAYWRQDLNIVHKSKYKGQKEPASKSIAKAMLDLKYKHRNASLGQLLFGYKDVVDRLSRIRGYKLGHLKSNRFFSKTNSRYLHKDYNGLQWPKLRHARRHKNLIKFIPSARRVPKFLMFKNKNSAPNCTYTSTFTDTYELTADKVKSKEQDMDKHEEEEFDILSPYTIKTHLNTLVQFFPDANITEEVIGKTMSYNDIVLLKVSQNKDMLAKFFRADENKYVEESPSKKVVLIVHGLSVMGWRYLPCMYDQDKFGNLARYYFKHLDKFDIFLIPMANPDGVAMPNELWNKNASPQSECTGVALDRNFEVAWNSTRHVSSCSQQYAGPYALSEPETRAIAEVFHKYSHKIIAYIHVHAGTYTADVFKGDAVLYPKGYTEMQSEDDKYVDLKGEIDEAIKLANFQVLSVTVDSLHSWYGTIAGSSVDYAATVYGIPYAMEFVMQIYTDDMLTTKSEEKETNVALDEVWRRVINVTFNCIYKSLGANEVEDINTVSRIKR